MKTLTLATLILSLTSTLAFAGTNADLAKVRALADRKISGQDVRKVIEIYDNLDGNPCAEAGRNFLVTVSVRKSVMKELADGSIGQEREWQELNRYSISKRDLRSGGDLSDALCQE